MNKIVNFPKQLKKNKLKKINKKNEINYFSI